MNIEELKSLEIIKQINQIEDYYKVELSMPNSDLFNIYYGNILLMENGCYILENKANKLYVFNDYQDKISKHLGEQFLIQNIYEVQRDTIEKFTYFLSENNIKHTVVVFSNNKKTSNAKYITLFERDGFITYYPGKKQTYSRKVDKKIIRPPFLKGENLAYGNEYKCLDYWYGCYEFNIWLNQVAKKWKNNKESASKICRNRSEAKNGIPIPKPQC